MNNTNVQVSPGNRVDFSRIRKAMRGMKIPKFQTPATPVYNFDDFLNNLPTNQFKRGQTKSSIPWTPNWEGINGKYANVEELEANDKYKAFTDYVIQNAQGENADPRVLEYLKLLEQTTINSNHKAILFDGNGNLNQNWADEYRRLRNDGKYGYYHLGPEGNPEPTPKEVKRRPLEFNTFPTRKGTPWTDWIPLSAMLANNLMTNIRNFGNAIKKRFPPREALHLQGKVTNNYAARQIREQQAADARTRAQQQLGSDIVQNQNYLNAVEQNIQDLENQNAIDQTEEFNRTSAHLEEIGNTNKIQAVDTANYNRTQNAAAWNNILAERNKLNVENTAELDSYIGSMYKSHGLWLQNERMEDARYNREVNEFEYQNGLNQAYIDSGLKALDEGGLKASEAFQAFKVYLAQHTEIQGATINGKITDDSVLAYIQANSTNPKVIELYNQFNKEKAEAEAIYQRSQARLASEKIKKDIQIDNTISNQGTRFGDRYIRHSIYEPRDPLYAKSGGKVKARFIDYMNHYQKQQQFDRKEARKVQENLQKKLARDLDYLDKETLLLLKQIFK